MLRRIYGAPPCPFLRHSPPGCGPYEQQELGSQQKYGEERSKTTVGQSCLEKYNVCLEENDLVTPKWTACCHWRFRSGSLRC